MTRTVNLQEAGSQLPELVSLARNGTDVVIAEAGTPLARLVPVQPVPVLHPRRPGLHRGVVTWMSDDFDDALPEEFWLGEGQ